MSYSTKREAKEQAIFNKRLFTFFNTQTALIELPSISNEAYRQAENKVWYLAQNPAELIKFYNTRIRSDVMYNTNNFYRVCNGSDLAFMHYNLAQGITRAMGNLLFSKTPTFTIKSGNQKTDKVLITAAEDILNDNSKMSMYLQASDMASYSGRVGFKLVMDTDLSKYPIINVYPKEQIDLIKSHGRVTDIVFKDYYSNNDSSTYVLYSIYGKGYIKYKLYLENFTITNQDANRTEVALDTLPETRNLQDIEFRYKDGKLVDKILAVVIDNKEGGISDYTGCIDDFISIDETYSQMETFIRTSGLKLYLPEIHASKNAKTGEITNRNLDYSTRVTFIPTANPNWQETKIERDVVEIEKNLQAYRDTMDNLIMRACQTAGLSPATMGYDIAGANASGEALNIRERTSLRTRAEKASRWSEGLSKLILVSLLMYSASKISDTVFTLDNIDANVYVEFAEYERDMTNENAELDIIIKKLNAGLISKKDALIQMYPTLDEKDIEIKLSELTDTSDNEPKDENLKK